MDEPGHNDSWGDDKDMLHVKIPAFDGPLDLLLHLVRKHELDIADLRLAELTEPYLGYLERMEALNLDSAGEFLAIAATLVWIKSKSLLPRDFTDDEPEVVDEEALLIERLQEYQRVKDAAVQLAELDILGRDRFARQDSLLADSESDEGPQERPPIEGVSLFQLIEAFREVLERAEEPPSVEVVPPGEPIEQRIESLLYRFEFEHTLVFHQLFAGSTSRQEIVLVFIALLELVRLKAVRIGQNTPQGEIICTATEEFLAAPGEWTASLLAALTGEDPLPPKDDGQTI